jgi:hypothetical protein
MKFELKKSSLQSKSFIVVAISVTLLLLLSNLAFSNYHLKQVLHSVDKSEEIMETYLAKVSLYSTERSDCYRSEIVGRVYCGSELDDWVRNKVVIVANNSFTDLSVEQFKFNRINLFPFGSELNESVDAYNEHIDIWLDYYKDMAGCSDYSCYYKEKMKPHNISSSFRIAEEAFKSVIPIVDMFDSQVRIKEIFKN